MKSERILNVAVAVLSLCAVVTTGLVVRREVFGSPAPAAQGTRTPLRIPAWQSFAREGRRMGPEAAPVTIVVFSDFQCRFCGTLMERLRTLRKAHPTNVSVVYRHFPVAGHDHAVGAARASECAGDQGRFEPYHDALFARRDSIGQLPWESFAATAGVPDLQAFKRCADDTGPVAAVARDTVAARQIYVTGTPTLLINDHRLQGAVPLDTLEAYVQRALRPAARPRS